MNSLAPTPGRPQREPQPGDGWVDCSCGERHWGLAGAAGLFLVNIVDGSPAAVVLQHRALWSHHGGLWGTPGGARAPGESAVCAALRESREEAGIPHDAVQVFATRALEHVEWSYTTVLAQTLRPIDPSPTDAESLAIRWVAVEEVTDLPLLPAFKHAWPGLLDVARTFASRECAELGADNNAGGTVSP